jgi:hypothetical protein
VGVTFRERVLMGLRYGGAGRPLLAFVRTRLSSAGAGSTYCPTFLGGGAGMFVRFMGSGFGKFTGCGVRAGVRSLSRNEMALSSRPGPVRKECECGDDY